VSLADAEFSVAVGEGPLDSVVMARGEIDIYTGEQLRALLHDVLVDKPGKLILDLSETTFIDSTGLSVIIGAFKRAQMTGVELVLQSPSRNVLRVMELTGLNRAIPIVVEPGHNGAAGYDGRVE
jgi:anti-anti-sigma factor